MFRFRNYILQLFQKREKCIRGGGVGGHYNSNNEASSSSSSVFMKNMIHYRDNPSNYYSPFRLFRDQISSAYASRSGSTLYSRAGPTTTRVKEHQVSPVGNGIKSSFFFFPGWAKWIFGSLLSFLIPFWKQSWYKLQNLEGEAEMVIEEAENVAETVEKVAEFTEKITAKIADKLPEKSILREAAEKVELFSNEIAHEAHLTQDFIHKVEEWKEKLDKTEAVIDEQFKKKNAKNKGEED